MSAPRQGEEWRLLEKHCLPALKSKGLTVFGRYFEITDFCFLVFLSLYLVLGAAVLDHHLSVSVLMNHTLPLLMLMGRS